MFDKKEKNNVNIEDKSVNNDLSLIKEDKKEKKEKKKKTYYLFFSAVINRFKEDKLYLLSFIITIVFIVIFSLYKVYDAEGLYKNKKDTNDIVDNNVTPTVSTDLKVDDELDVSDYVGIYSREIILDSPVQLSDTCSVTTYKFIYQIKKDKSISKYFMNDCLGTYLIWKNELSYVSTGGARYISANDINYLFSTTNMKEVDGDAYKLESDITSVKENKKYKKVETSFDGDRLILMAYNNLFLINENKIEFELNSEYLNNGGDLEQRVYKTDTENTYKFVVFSNEENKSCYKTGEISASEFVDGSLYKIYSIKYDSDEHKFNTAKEIISRDKSAGCDVLDEDLLTLK